MDLRFTLEQDAFREKARQFAVTEAAAFVPHMEEEGEASFPAKLVERMGELDLMGIPLPREWGGAGADFVSYIAVIQELSRVSAALGVILSVHTSVGTLPILRHGTEEQRQRYVRKLASGEWLGAFALTEPHAGSDAASIRMSARADNGGGYVLNGTKLFITNAGAAQVYLTFAVTDPSRGNRGITAFILERDTPGFVIGKKERKMGLHGSNTCELLFDEVRVDASRRLGAEGEGFAIAMGALDGGRIGIGAQALGIAEAAHRLLEDGLRPRSQNDGSRMSRKRGLASDALPAELAALADIASRTEAAKLLVYRAADLYRQGKPCTKEASTAKLFASDTAVKAAGAAVRWLGADGYDRSAAAQRLFRDAKVTQIYEGTNEIHRIVIGSKLLR